MMNTDTAMITDMLGQKIDVGDIVVHGGRSGTAGFLDVGRVEKMVHGTCAYGRPCPKVSIRKLYKTWDSDEWVLHHKVSNITLTDQLLVIDGSSLPDKIRTLFGIPLPWSWITHDPAPGLFKNYQVETFDEK